VGKLSHADVVHLLVQLGIMLIMGRILAEIARKFNQPAVVGEILAGILLGPTVLGMLQPDWFEALYPSACAYWFSTSGRCYVAIHCRT
jgi:Sodium/hydrogen exchanger family